jgi:hypothetical protein
MTAGKIIKDVHNKCLFKNFNIKQILWVSDFLFLETE